MSAPREGLRVELRIPLSQFEMEISASFPARGISGVFGDSGSGKTTLLRAIAGFENRARGAISFDGEVWQGVKLHLPTHQRQVGYVFQEPSLFSHLDVRGNLEFGYKRTPLSQRRVDSTEVIGLLGLKGLLDRRVSRLSGGEKQRVAIGRALLASPQLLLLDEPLSSLDWSTRHEILPYLRRMADSLDLPMIYVSHDLEEIVQLASHLTLVREGRIQASGPVREVIESMTSSWQKSRVRRMISETSESEEL